MKQLLAALLCLLLCGCAPQTAPEPETATQPLPERVSLYDPTHPMEQANPGVVRAYPLTLRKVQNILPRGKRRTGTFRLRQYHPHPFFRGGALGRRSEGLLGSF